MHNLNMRKLFLLWMMTVAASAFAAEVPSITHVSGRQGQSLNGAWHYIVDVQEEGFYDYRMNETRWGFFQNAKPQRPEDLIESDFDKSAVMDDLNYFKYYFVTSACSSMRALCG